MHNHELAALLQRLGAGPPIDLGDLAVVPLLAADLSVEADLLAESLARGTTEVAEVDEKGDVNRVVVRHHGRWPLLLIDGEELIGAKQNRVLNASFLVAPGSAVVVPVSCVEQGRWRRRSASFDAAERTLASPERTAKLRRVTTSVTTTGRHDADQGQVWRDVNATLQRHSVRSSTQAYADVVAARAGDIERRVDALAPIDGQVGLATVAGDRLLAADLLGSPSLYRRGWRKLARGLVAEVGPPSRSPRAAAVVLEALAQAARIPYTRASGTGMGETLHGMGGHAVSGLVTGAVVSGGAVYHAVIGGAM